MDTAVAQNELADASVIATKIHRVWLVARAGQCMAGPRSPHGVQDQGDGRDHNPYGFTMWMAGGGVQGGQTIGATDEVGLHAVQDRLHIHDLHASILHLMGIDNMQLTYLHQGSPERPTQNEGAIFEKLV